LINVSCNDSGTDENVSTTFTWAQLTKIYRLDDNVGVPLMFTESL
jgi:hypothetical protein